jgi:hypothetical protein
MHLLKLQVKVGADHILTHVEFIHLKLQITQKKYISLLWLNNTKSNSSSDENNTIFGHPLLRAVLH